MKEKESNSNTKTLLLSVIAVIALIAIVGGATFAFFATTRDINASTPVNTQTAASMYSFSATANETIEFNLSATEMSEANVKESVLKSDNANIYMEVASATDNETTTCTYDIQWVWDSVDKYTESDVTLPHTDGDKTYPYELSITVDGENETDLSKLTWNDNKAIVASGLEIKSTSKTPVKITHNIEVKSYNIPVDQQKLYNKDFRAHLEVVNNSCTATTGSSEPEPSATVASTFFTDKVGETINLEDNGETYTGAIVNENGLRFEGKNPNNYVEFNDELWRIIGVFDSNTHGRSGEQLVKLIRANKLSQYYQWDNTGSYGNNNWNTAVLKTTLNTNYYNNSTINACSNYNSSSCTATTVTGEGIKTDVARNMIQPIQWKLGGHNEIAVPASVMYEKERGTTLPSSSGATAVSTENLPIGLMYPSDYGYAVEASNCARTTNLGDYASTAACHTENWLWNAEKPEHTWTLSPNSGNSYIVWYVYCTGYVTYNNAYNTFAAVPVLYLKAGVKIAGGQGTKTSPYTLQG